MIENLKIGQQHHFFSMTKQLRCDIVAPACCQHAD